MKVINKILNFKVTLGELELAVYYTNKEIFEYLLDKYYQQNPVKIEERILKACINQSMIEYVLLILKYTTKCKSEFEEGIINNDEFKWKLSNLGSINNMKIITKKKEMLIDVDTENFSILYNSNSIVHLAIEQKSNDFITKILETDANLMTKRKNDNATPLIMAVKVYYFIIIEK